VTSLASDATSVTFPVTFKYLATSEVKATRTDSASSADTVLTEITHYTISGSSGDTGTFTFTATGAALFAADDLLTFNRIMERASDTFDQTTDYTQNDQLDADTLEQNFDKSVMISQQLKEAADRTMTFSETATFNTDAETASTLIATKTARASKGIRFDSNGDIGISVFDPDEQASTATTKAAIATTQAAAAAVSASAASTSENNAAASATEASASATNAATSETNSTSSQVAAAASAAAASATSVAMAIALGIILTPII
jgi:hypothetical protein